MWDWHGNFQPPNSFSRGFPQNFGTICTQKVWSVIYANPHIPRRIRKNCVPDAKPRNTYLSLSCNDIPRNLIIFILGTPKAVGFFSTILNGKKLYYAWFSSHQVPNKCNKTDCCGTTDWPCFSLHAGMRSNTPQNNKKKWSAAYSPQLMPYEHGIMTSKTLLKPNMNFLR